jgi:hypothetical protein
MIGSADGPNISPPHFALDAFETKTYTNLNGAIASDIFLYTVTEGSADLGSHARMSMKSHN